MWTVILNTQRIQRVFKNQKKKSKLIKNNKKLQHEISWHLWLAFSTKMMNIRNVILRFKKKVCVLIFISKKKWKLTWSNIERRITEEYDLQKGQRDTWRKRCMWLYSSFQPCIYLEKKMNKTNHEIFAKNTGNHNSSVEKPK